MGVILLDRDVSVRKYELCPRYGGYSKYSQTKQTETLGCVPVMGVIPKNLLQQIEAERLCPRYGGYSNERLEWLEKQGLFPRYGVIPALPYGKLYGPVASLL